MIDWTVTAIAKLRADRDLAKDTDLLRVRVPSIPDITLYLKDESTQITGSLKHRLASDLFLHGICSGWIKEGTTIVEASSGSTAVSEAYFAQLLGLPFVAVVPRTTARSKIEEIESYGGQCRLVDGYDIYSQAQVAATELNGHYMDQFTFSERVVDWRGSDNIASSIFSQLEVEASPIPAWFVLGAGTGGTAATIGRYTRLHGISTSVCVVDPEGSVLYDAFHGCPPSAEPGEARGSLIEGIGRPRVEPSFFGSLIDRMIKVSDEDSVATMLFLREKLGLAVGGSTGTSVFGVFLLMAELAKAGYEGSIVSIIGDSGKRYLDTYYNERWREQANLKVDEPLLALERFWTSGVI